MTTGTPATAGHMPPLVLVCWITTGYTCRGRGDAKGTGERDQDAAPVPRDMAPPQATEQGAGPSVEGFGHDRGIAWNGRGRYPAAT